MRNSTTTTVGTVLLLASALLFSACNNESPPAKVGSGAGQTNNTGAPSGRVTTQGEAQATGGGQ